MYHMYVLVHVPDANAAKKAWSRIITFLLFQKLSKSMFIYVFLSPYIPSWTNYP